ncbi:MAG: dicarboxylate/amino acid:cation symporter [Alphaproteobacteria bacterium]|nr:dicarboxylate/amino acid:cation symporter [Alphaproteobacteria bacterium]
MQTTINLLSILAGAAIGYIAGGDFLPYAHAASDIFVRIIRFLAVPLIFFSLLSTILTTGNSKDVRSLFGHTLKYTVGTTTVAAIIALITYKILDPISGSTPPSCGEGVTSNISYLDSFANIVPSNILDIFLTNNIAGAVILAVIFGFFGKKILPELQKSLASGISALSEMFLLLAQYTVKFLPAFLWAFMVIFVQDLKKGFVIGNTLIFLIALIVANLIHALIFLPLLLRKNGISATETIKASLPALSVAFFTKSSNIAIPSSLKVCEKLKIKPFISRFTIPVCATINMNGCGIFIFLATTFMTEVFVNPMEWWQYIVCIATATLVAIGNAGVPMGCFFLTTSLLAIIGTPTYLMGVLLPVFMILDMLETTVNVWSDIVITRCINKKMSNLE